MDTGTRSSEIAMQPPTDATQVGVSPVGLNQTIVQKPGGIVVATDIKSVWNGGSEVGWVYHGSDNRNYFQENLAVVPQKSYGAELADLIPGAGQALSKAHINAGGGINMPTGDAPIVEMPPGPVEAHLPPGSILVQGIDHAERNPSPRAGHQFHGSPETIGDQIPTGKGHGTTSVTGINAIMHGATTTGWVYKGSDGIDYFQRRTDTTIQPTGSVSMGPVSGSIAPAQFSEIQSFKTGVLLPGERLMPMDATSRIFDDKLGVPSQGNPPATELHAGADGRDGNKTLAALGVSVGDFATVQVQRNDFTVANVERPGQEQQRNIGRA